MALAMAPSDESVAPSLSLRVHMWHHMNFSFFTKINFGCLTFSAPLCTNHQIYEQPLIIQIQSRDHTLKDQQIQRWMIRRLATSLPNAKY